MDSPLHLFAKKIFGKKNLMKIAETKKTENLTSHSID